MYYSIAHITCLCDGEAKNVQHNIKGFSLVLHTFIVIYNIYMWTEYGAACVYGGVYYSKSIPQVRIINTETNNKRSTMFKLKECPRVQFVCVGQTGVRSFSYFILFYI